MNCKQADRTLLVVDDDRLMLRAMDLILRREGYKHIFLADSVDQALTCISRNQPRIDILLTDLNMPGRDGIELLREVAESGYCGDVIMISSEDQKTLDMAERLARTRGLSILGTLAKPIQRSQLFALLAKKLDKPKKPVAAVNHRSVDAAMLAAAIGNGELEPWFQPKVDIASRTPVGVEMLARWPRSPLGGPVFPDQFIPIAEEHGLIDELTFCLLEQAAQVARTWRRQGIDLKIAFNVSVSSLNLGFPEKIYELLDRLGEDYSDYQVEVTESCLVEDHADPLDVLIRMRMKKLKLSIDDFGTGHSNLNQLQQLPFDELKIDKSFVQFAHDDHRALAILQSSFDIAKKLKLNVVAEGVETYDEWQRVERLGCEQAQGYFIAHPMPASEIPGWIKDWPRLQQTLFRPRPKNAPAVPPDEESCVQTTHSINLLDACVEDRFKCLTRLAHRLFDVAIVFISLADDNRQWFKSSIGLPEANLPRDETFSSLVSLNEQVIEVSDARQDDRFVDHPLVTGEPHIRFYGGYPLKHSDGIWLGTLCLADPKPHVLDKEDLSALRDLAALVAWELSVMKMTPRL